MNGHRRALRWLAAHQSAALWLGMLPALACLTIFVLVPLFVLTLATFWKSSVEGIDPVWNFGNYRKLIADAMFARLILKSLRIAVTVTTTTLVLGYPLAYVIARKSSRYKHLLILLVFVPYWISYVIRTYAWYPILGKEGAINYILRYFGVAPQPIFLFNEFAVHLGLVSVFMPFAVVPIYLSLERIRLDLLEAAADLGARPPRCFVHIVLPLSLPGLLGAALMVFILTVGAYVTPQLLGGPGGIMVGNVIADQFGATFNWTWGGTLSLLLMVVTLLVILLVSRQVRISQIFVAE